MFRKSEARFLKWGSGLFLVRLNEQEILGLDPLYPMILFCCKGM